MPGAPSLPPGTWGDIRYMRRAGAQPGWRAIAQFCDQDDVVRQVERAAPTKPKAKAKLTAALAARADAMRGGDIGPTARLRMVADRWLARLARRVDDGNRSPNTLALYRHTWTNHIAPRAGDWRLDRIDVQRVDRLLTEITDERGYPTAKTARGVLSGMLGMAARFGAIPTNPVRDVEALSAPARDPVRALSPGEAVDLWNRISDLTRTGTCDPDLPDLVLWMLGTSERIGNTLAAHWPWLDLNAATAALGPNVIRVKGEGLRLNHGTTKTRARMIDLPEPVIAMLLARREQPRYRPMGPVFPDSFGGLRDPRNTNRSLRRAFNQAGYPWVTSHVFRKTVATVLDDAELSARQVADQLGHAKPSMTQDVYMARKARNPRAKAALEAMLTTEPEQKVIDLPRGG